MIFFFDHPHASEAAAVAEVGGKGASLSTIRSLGLPVPPGFTIGIGAARRIAATGLTAADRRAIADAVSRLEAETGQRFGDPSAPLLLAVRSGAAMSMPGMMDTLLNIGATPAVVSALAATADPGFAAEIAARAQAGIAALRGAAAPAATADDPAAALQAAIAAVAASWHAPRARAYRRRMGLPDDGGTAVTVQAMVFGNRCDRSATGVAFSRCPDTGRPGARGDILFRAQGEDVVAGRRQTLPLTALRETLPEAAARLDTALDRLETRYRDLVDVEFTIESGRLFILQARRGKRSAIAAARIARDLAHDPRVALSRAEALARAPLPLLLEARNMRAAAAGATPLAVGVPASPGLVSGPVALSPEQAIALAETGPAPILVRA
ncbi:MAG: PEP/pyruvate-binding domain-containing protein, partial [Thermaurantiacus sp.]